MGMTRKPYTDQFKEEAVKLAQNVGFNKAANDLGINPCNIRRWHRMAQDGHDENTSSTPPLSELEKENLKLKKELRYLYEINEVLKKSLGIFAKEKNPSL